MAQLYPQSLGSLYVISYVSQGYGGCILTLPQPGRARSPYMCVYPSGTGWSSPKSNHVTTDGQSISVLVHSPLGIKGISIPTFNPTSGVHYGEIVYVTTGRAACEAHSATWNLGTNSAFALGSRKTTENFDRVSRSQDLQDAKSKSLYDCQSVCLGIEHPCGCSFMHIMNLTLCNFSIVSIEAVSSSN
jgi:hypothetical protein